MNLFRKFLDPVNLAYTTWWCFWILAESIVLHRQGVPWIAAATDAGTTMAVLAIGGYVISTMFRFYTPSPRNILLLAVSAVLLSILNTWVIEFILTYLNVLDKTRLAMTSSERVVFSLLMVTLLVVFHWMFNTAQTQAQLKKRQEEGEKLLIEAELSRLRQQLQPHFLFNSLNSISALAGTNPEAARHMVQQLSDFLRGTLKKDEQQLVPLDEELHLLDLYLQIEKVRFGNRLEVIITCDDACRKLLLPALLLQPVVENAVKFGLYDTLDVVTLRISASCTENQLVVTVENPFDPLSSAPRSGTGFGLASIRRRLVLLYARHDLVETATRERLFTTTLHIPQNP